jgi:hypothetical protein
VLLIGSLRFFDQDRIWRNVFGIGRWTPRMTTSRADTSQVSLYLGLATAIVTFSAGAVALGLLECRRHVERVVSVVVLLCATLGIGASLATVAESRATGARNILIAAGLCAAAIYVLFGALRSIFAKRAEAEGAKESSDGIPGATGSDSGPSADTSYRRAMLLTMGVFFSAVVLAAAFTSPDPFPGLLTDHSLTPSCSEGSPSLADQRLPRQFAAVQALARHFELINQGDYTRAFALMTPAYRARNPAWVDGIAKAEPAITVTFMGLQALHGNHALVPTRFYARVCQTAQFSDIKCRRFSGRARMTRVNGDWRYDPSASHYRATVVSSRFCR